MYFTGDSLIDINNKITDLKNVTLRKHNVKPCGYDKTYMDELIDQFNEIKFNLRDFYSILLYNINPFYDGKGIT